MSDISFSIVKDLEPAIDALLQQTERAKAYIEGNKKEIPAALEIVTMKLVEARKWVEVASANLDEK